ncbi:MAG TPA: cation:dicarboxylase symporter family transporter [Spirochaetota bacterium]|nr:cation:dicarboxylase symporter family transporter [Spirochaetota bacterium]HOS54822.1 cation:dicarboxylase symporter family transporter [Spirochaetota bacterium]HPK63049.1 cation:dicarboxylase symporter family transporter [Spirochaetota bacterium]HQF76777.1 cation:dicarboxylase symporter family transporter [Spirochaetota bacterium]HQH30838.1 cation:dicarboxylase symporter family transporter [Spirochaetota bacterium]
MKIWLKMLFSIVIGLIIGAVVPKDIEWFNSVLKIISSVSVNLLLYFTALYVPLKIFIGFNSLKEKSKKFIWIFFLSIVISLLFSAIISIGIMNIEIFQQGKEFRVFQISGKPVELLTFGEIINNIISPNLINSFTGQIKYLLPLIFVGLIFALASRSSSKKMQYFIEITQAFEEFVDKIIKQILEIFPFLAIFYVIYLTGTGFLNVDYKEFIKKEGISYLIILKPLIAIILSSAIVLFFSFIFLRIILKKNVALYFLGILGAGLIGFVTGNSASALIPLSAHLKRNIGVNQSASKILSPLGIVFNKTGTIIVASVVLMTILYTFHLNKISFQLQFVLFAILFLFTFRLDGANDFGFIALAAMVLSFKPLKLEENSYLLFWIFLPLLNRIAIFVDVVTTGILVIISAKFSDNLENRQYIDFI